MENLRASWEAAYSLFWSKFDNCFTYAKTAVRARAYVRGLMSGIERKNGWQLAEYIGDEAPYAVQIFFPEPCGMLIWGTLFLWGKNENGSIKCGRKSPFFG